MNKSTIQRMLFPLSLLTVLASNVYAKDGENETTGRISARSSSAITVQGINFPISSGTECETSSSVNIACSSLIVGDLVEVHWSGNYSVREITRLSSSSSPGATPTPNVTATPSSGNGGGNSNDDKSGSKKNARLRVNLGDDDSSEVAGGKAEYRVKSKETRFTVTVKVPEGSSPLIESIDDARALSIKAQLSRGGSMYAECNLKFSASSVRTLPDNTLQYEFKVDLRKKGSKYLTKKGQCDVRLNTAGMQNGIPAVRRDDTISIVETSVGEFLEGTF